MENMSLTQMYVKSLTFLVIAQVVYVHTHTHTQNIYHN